MSNLRYINGHSKAYHLALESVDHDLVLLCCEDLWPDPIIVTQKAYGGFVGQKGGIYHIASPISSITAAVVSDHVWDYEEMLAFLGSQLD